MLEIATLLANNWKPIAAAVLFAGIYFTGLHHGSIATAAKYEAKLQEIRAAAEAERAARQADSDRIDASTAEALNEFNGEIFNLSGRLTNATLNPAYRCVPDADGLRALNAIRNAAGIAASKRND